MTRVPLCENYSDRNNFYCEYNELSVKDTNLL